MLIIPPAIRKLIVEAVVDTGAPLDALTCGLFLSSYVPSVNSTFTEVEASKATYSGYAVQTPVVWEGPFIDANLTAYMLGALFNFTAVTATPFVPNSIGGYYLYNGTSLKGIERFTDPVTGLPAPIAMIAPGNLTPVIPRFSFGQ